MITISVSHLLRRLAVSLLALALLGPAAAEAQYRVLFIGNSFTIGSGGGGVPGIFDRLAQAGGHPDPTTVMRAVGGQNFQFHAQDATTQATIASQPWTHVVLQNYSTEPTHLASGSVPNHYTYGSLLYRQVLTNHALTRVVLFETWSRAEAHSLITGVSSPSSFASTAEFQTELRTNYQGLANTLNAQYPANPPVVVAPVGTAWENAGGLRPAGDPFFVPLFASDNYHGNDNGYYLAACVIYSTIYGVSPLGLATNALVAGLNLNFTVSPALLEDAAWATVSGSGQLGPQSFLLDFGGADAATTHGPAPGDPANRWNNVTEAIGASSNGELAGLVASSGTPTDIRLAMLSRFNGVNQNGTTSASVFPASATLDSLFGNTETFGGLANVFPSFKLANLSPSRSYSFQFYASRTGVTDNRETAYTVTGNNTGQAVLDPANNTDATAWVVGILPDEAGEITISLAPSANNNNPFHFTYLGVLRVDAVPRQEPIVFTRQPASLSVPERMPAQFTVELEGTPPYFVQWLSNGIAIPGANQFSYTIPSTTTNMSGTAFAVTVSNLAYAATSEEAVLTVTPAQPHPAPRALLFDFGGANTTGLGAPPNDPLSFWNNVTTAVGASSTARLTNLVTAINAPTTIGLVMLSRFNGANENGTLNAPILPPNATRDSLFGNTESWSGLANVFPSFKLAGLDPATRYDLTFYASRLGVSDNRETGYTVIGANTGFAALDAGNNVTNTARVTGILPTAAREITIRLAPTANNNNANHFTYLGALRLDPVPPPPAFLPPVLADGMIILDWTGEGQLRHAPTPQGPWSPILPPPTPPYIEPVTSAPARFFRLEALP